MAGISKANLRKELTKGTFKGTNRIIQFQSTANT